jgi:hypothetical protein
MLLCFVQIQWKIFALFRFRSVLFSNQNDRTKNRTVVTERFVYMETLLMTQPSAAAAASFDLSLTTTLSFSTSSSVTSWQLRWCAVGSVPFTPSSTSLSFFSNLALYLGLREEDAKYATSDSITIIMFQFLFWFQKWTILDDWFIFNEKTEKTKIFIFNII